MKEQFPDLRIVPRTQPQHVEAMLAAGAEGAVVSFPDEETMRAFSERYR